LRLDIRKNINKYFDQANTKPTVKLTA